MTNSIFWGASPNNIFNQDVSIDTPVVRYSNLHGGLSPGTIDGGGNIAADPLFDDDDLRLSAGSPCIDAGDNSVVTVPTDLDGNARIVDDAAAPDCPQAPGTCGTPPIVDMGAYEFGSAPCGPADFDCDGDVDLCDFAKWAVCFQAMEPSACNPFIATDLNGDGRADWDDYTTFHAELSGPN